MSNTEKSAVIRFRSVSDKNQSHTLFVADANLWYLRILAVSLTSLVEEAKGGKWYCSSIYRDDNCMDAYPHPEDFPNFKPTDFNRKFVM